MTMQTGHPATRTALLTDRRYLMHQPGEYHPECPERLTSVLHHLETLPWFSRLKQLTARAADMEWIAAVHRPDYIHRTEAACRAGYARLDCPDVGISPGSFHAAELASGGALELADRLMAGEINNGFALIRPPGHHAEARAAMGFCLFNNIAILARYLQRKHGLEKILILDWDVHHGNGTQHTFEEEPDVLYISLHQYPFYPGTGAAHENGIGRGRGATLNCPMPAGAGDHEYEEAFRTKIFPKIAAFRPDVVLISAGFDAHRDDPLAGICLSTDFFGWMTGRMLEVAERYAGNRLISLLEGGYHLDELPRSIARHLAVLSGIEKA